jgi:hypothetical protein
MNRLRKILLLLLAAAMWFTTGRVQRVLNADRAALGLTRLTPLENAPPMLAFTTVALGGFRGLIANYLWLRANQMQEQGRYFEMIQLSDWITKLQPHFTMVWRYQAWNMAYNISVKFRDPADRWRWVQRGIELLRDEGLRYNPGDTQMYNELAWFYQHKLGYYLDDAHAYYKQQWAHDMMKVLGVERVDYLSLIDPQTDEQRSRARTLREKYKLDPEEMRAVDKRYGPLEWRLPEAHAIYWASLGLKRAGKEGQLSLRREIWQSIRLAFRRGRLIPVKAVGRFEFGPNVAIAAKVDEVFEQLMAEDPEQRDAMTAGHRDFLAEAVYLLYTHNRRAEAERFFTKLRQRYPEAVPASWTLDEFAVNTVTEKGTRSSTDRVRATIEGLLQTAYENLAIGEDDLAAGHDRLAQQIWQRHQTRFADQQERMGLPPMKNLRDLILGRLLDPKEGLPPQLQAQLRTVLNLPAPVNTNAPVVAPPK